MEDNETKSLLSEKELKNVNGGNIPRIYKGTLCCKNCSFRQKYYDFRQIPIDKQKHIDDNPGHDVYLTYEDE